MTSFAYRAYTHEGDKTTGTLDAADMAEARRLLSENGLLVADVTAERKSLTDRNFSIGRSGGKVKMKDVAWMARTLASTERAGLPLFAALGLVSRQKAGTPLGEMINDIRNQVADGTTLGNAFRTHEDKVGHLACALIEVGERSGTLGESFAQLAHVTEAQVRLRRQLKSAMTYPLAVLFLAGGLFIAMLLFVVPTFEKLFEDAGAELPVLTRALVGMSNTMTDYLWLVLIAVASLVMIVRTGRHRPSYRSTRDRLLMKLPLMGDLIVKVSTARLSGALAAMLRSGEAMLDAISMSGNAAGNAVMAEAMERIREDVGAGSPLSAAFRREPLIDEMLAGLVQVGEEAGSVDEMLTRYAQIAEEEAESTVEAMTSLIEPMLVVALGGVIGVAVIGLYLPMFDIAQVVAN
jgi:type IV pilus assembly protein PilC